MCSSDLLGRIQVAVGIDQYRSPPSDARLDQHAVAQRHAPVGTGSQIQVMDDDDHGCAQLTCQAMQQAEKPANVPTRETKKTDSVKSIKKQC